MTLTHVYTEDATDVLDIGLHEFLHSRLGE
jgi:hypothetical protein